MTIDSGRQDQETERRQHERVKIDEDVIAMIGPPPSDIGWLVDVSLGGFAFIYKGRKKRLKKTPDRVLLLEEGRSSSHGAPLKCDVQIVSSSEAMDGRRNGFSSKKRCSVQFGELTYYQKAWLQSLIQKQSNSTAPSDRP